MHPVGCLGRLDAAAAVGTSTGVLSTSLDGVMKGAGERLISQ